MEPIRLQRKESIAGGQLERRAIRGEEFYCRAWDSDAPKAGGFCHWMIVNIPSSAHALPAGTGNIEKRLTPSGAVQLKNDYGDPGYGGPCPPGHQVHHYHFLLYALRVEQLPVDQRTAPGNATSLLQKEIIATAEVVGTYGR